MQETWLKPNRRAIWFGSILPLGIAAFGAWMATWSGTAGRSLWNWFGMAIVIVAVILLAALARQAYRPRIAYRDGRVLFNLRSGPPIGVPVHVVEAFFVGQGPANIPGNANGQEKTYNLVARLAQREKDWAERDVKPAFGNWSEGYVTVRGTWCEPLHQELVRQLNRRLKEVKTEVSQATADAAAH